MRTILFLFFMLSATVVFAGNLMNQARMEAVIKENASKHSGEGGVVKFEYHGVRMAVISDVTHDRMRIIAPIKKYAGTSQEQIDNMMVANFHSALDARYAVSQGILYSAFIHPLSTLDEGMLKSAMDQVANLALSFGSEYTSGSLVFGGQNKIQKEKRDEVL